MISFYPGPSRVHDEIPHYTKEAFKQGILSINHRSDAFMKISEKVIQLLKVKLEIPKDFTIFFTTSATECWEMIAQSVISKTSYHVYNGSFGKKWFEYTKRIQSGAKSFTYHHNALLKVQEFKLKRESGVICLTQNETSNGTQILNSTIRAIKDRHPQNLIAIDATSSMAGVYLDFEAADIWFASVQKCFGLPAGLGLMMCSPEAMKKIKSHADKKYYNSLLFMAEMMEKWQTPFTPNVLNIYLLMRVLENSKPIKEVHAKIEDRFNQWVDFFREKNTLQHFIPNEEARSYTVIPVQAKEALISAIKLRARKNDILLGEGYGELKSNTFRIANFPAIKKKEIETLKDFLEYYK